MSLFSAIGDLVTAPFRLVGNLVGGAWDTASSTFNGFFEGGYQGAWWGGLIGMIAGVIGGIAVGGGSPMNMIVSMGLGGLSGTMVGAAAAAPIGAAVGTGLGALGGAWRTVKSTLGSLIPSFSSPEVAADAPPPPLDKPKLDLAANDTPGSLTPTPTPPSTGGRAAGAGKTTP